MRGKDGTPAPLTTEDVDTETADGTRFAALLAVGNVNLVDVVVVVVVEAEEGRVRGDTGDGEAGEGEWEDEEPRGERSERDGLRAWREALATVGEAAGTAAFRDAGVELVAEAPARAEVARRSIVATHEMRV